MDTALYKRPYDDDDYITEVCRYASFYIPAMTSSRDLQQK
jgi:hypothetical protein